MPSTFHAAPAPATAPHSPYLTAPAFAPHELDIIAAWSAAMRAQGVSTHFDLGHTFLTEALQIAPTGTDDPCWLVHKTPTGNVAVRLWPGLADIVPTIEAALARVAHDLAEESCIGSQRQTG